MSSSSGPTSRALPPSVLSTVGMPHRSARMWCRSCSKLFRDSTDGRSAASPLGCVSKDRKSTRLNSSHVAISYAVFCLKKKKKKKYNKKQQHKKERRTTTTDN